MNACTSGATRRVTPSVSSSSGGNGMVPVAHRVAGRRVDVEARSVGGAHEVVTIFVEPLVPEAPETPAPGQFHMLWLPAVGEVPVSVSGFDGGVLSFTIAAVGATTEALCEAPIGSLVGLRGPFGNGWSLTDPGRDLVVVAGGLGLAPLRMLVLAEATTRSRSASGRLVVVVGARSPAELLFADELERLTGHAELALTVDHAGSSWSGSIGLVTEPLRRIRVEPGARARICGPEVMMRVTARALVDAGLDPAAVEVSLERSMACAVAHCGRCQVGPVMLCRDGPVLSWAEAGPLMEVRRW